MSKTKFLKDHKVREKFTVPGVYTGRLLQIDAGSCKVQIPDEDGKKKITTISHYTEIKPC